MALRDQFHEKARQLQSRTGRPKRDEATERRSPEQQDVREPGRPISEEARRGRRPLGRTRDEDGADV